MSEIRNMMSIDIRTLALMICISSFLQAIALAIQFALNRRYRGIEWWVLGGASTATGLVFLLMREVVSGRFFTIILANTLIVAGSICIFVGVARFAGRKEKWAVIASLFTVFVFLYFYFTYGSDNITARTAIVSAIIAFFAGMTAWSLLADGTHSTTASERWFSAIFLVYGLFMAFRAAVTLVIDPVTSLFTPTVMQIATFIVIFVYVNLLTYGLIILLSQRTNAEIQETKEHFELVFNTIPDATLVTRLSDGLIMDVNDGFTEHTGYTRAETKGKTTLTINLWENPDDRREIVDELRKHGLYRNRDVLFRRKDGSVLRGSMSAVLFPMHDELYFLSVTRDISDRIEAEEKIRRLNSELESKVAQRTAELETSNRELAEFTCALSHDLRTPLRAINGFSKILMDDHAEKYDDEVKRILYVIRSNTQRMDSMMSDMLQFSGLASVQLRQGRIDMTSLALSAFDEVLREAFPDSTGEPPVRLTLPSLEDAWADRNLTGKVWKHLIENAVKFTRGRHDRSIVIGSTRQGDMVEYFVKDSGIGFNPDYAPKLFGLFQRLHSPAEFEGTGTGLAIVKRIVERHGGKVRAESNPDFGATVFFSLHANGWKGRTP